MGRDKDKDKSKKSRKHKRRSRSRSRSPSDKEKHEKEKHAAPSDKSNGDAGGSGAAELSMSMEETNKMRIALGMAPLAVPASSSTGESGEDREKAIAAQEAEHKDRDSERRRKQRARKEQLANAATLADEGSGVSAAEWLARSKAKQDTSLKKQKAKREARVFEAKYEEMDYTCEDLAGLKVKHNMDQFTEGNETVLTLKDRSILEYKDGNLVLDRDEDELENIQMREEERRKTIEDRKKGKLEYSAHDEENAEKLLAQYDEEKDYAGEMRIGQAPKSKAESEKAQEAIRARLASSVGGEKKMYSLEYETGKVQNDTMDISEMVTFKKKKKKKKTKKSKKVAFLKEPESYEEHKQDHGLRAMRQAQLAAEAQKEFDLRDQRYLRALAKAEAETEKLLVYDEEELLEDAELRSFVDRARRVTQEQATKAEEKEKEEEEDKEKAPLSVGERQAQELANAIKLKREADLKVKQEPEPEPVATEATSESSGVVLKREGVFTSTTEFCRGLGHMESGQDDDKEKERKAALREQVAKAEAAKKEKQKSKEKAAADGEEGKEGQEEDDEEEEEEEDSFINDEPLASAGMFAALTLAKRRGHVQKYVEQRGRAKDEQLWSKEEDPAPHIKLEHRDDEGNILKPKEAYRHLSHVFHGRPPGAQKREKELKKRRELERATSERFLKSKMSKFAKTTQKAGQAYVVLDKKLTQDEVKAKQEAAAEEARVRAQFTAEKMTKEVDSSKRKRGESGDKRKKKKAKKVGLS